MKLGIVILVLGVALLLVAIPYSIVGIITGVNEVEEDIVSGGIRAYIGLIGVVLVFIMTAVGAVRVFKR